MRKQNNAFTISACALFTLVGAACADNVAGPSPSSPVPPSQATAAARHIQQAVAGRRVRGVEDEILRMEAALPGLGGLFVDSRGDVVVFVSGNQNEMSARAVLTAQVGRLNFSDRILAALRTGERLEVRRGDYSFSTLVAWTEALAPRLGNIKGIIAIDADEALNRVRVTINNENLSDQVIRAASAAGVPRAAIATSVGLTPVPLASLRGTWRPTGGGVQITNAGGGRCTLGSTSPQGRERSVF